MTKSQRIRTDDPLVSVGIAVYNGEAFIVDAIESILSQSFTDFELIISDNASEDRTWQIVQKYASQDERIRIRRNHANLGATINAESLIEDARGCYFLWVGADDRLGAGFLEESVKRLAEDRDAVGCYGTTEWFFDDGRAAVRREPFEDYANADMGKRIRALLFSRQDDNPVYSLFRRDVARSALGIRYRIHKDVQNDLAFPFLAIVLAQGKIVICPESVYFKRQHPGSLGAVRVPALHAITCCFDCIHPLCRRLKDAGVPSRSRIQIGVYFLIRAFRKIASHLLAFSGLRRRRMLYEVGA